MNYKLIINDDYGDGICCGFFSGNGSFTLFNDSGVSLGTGGEFTDSDSISFCVQNVSISELPNDMLIQVMPNPAKDLVKISAKSAISSIEVTSMTGQLISKQLVQGNNAEMNVSNLTSGTYFIKVNTENNSGIYKLIIE